MKQTGQELDLAIEGMGFFQVTNPDGQIVYTRAGNFSKNANGNLVVGSASDGRLLDPPIVIPADATGITITPEGIVTVQQQGSNQMTQVGQIQLASFINSQGLLQLGKICIEKPTPRVLRQYPIRDRTAWGNCSKTCWNRPTSNPSRN